MAQAQRKFSNIIDLNKGVEKYCRMALVDTLEELSDILYGFIRNDIYNTRRGKFYQRTRILLIKGMIQTKIWNAFSASRVGGTLSFDENLFNRSINLKDFQHGNDYFGELSLQSYLEILNSKNDWDNPFGFGMVNRGLFWDNFMDEIKSRGGFGEIYRKNLDKYVLTTTVYGKPHYTPRRVL